MNATRPADAKKLFIADWDCEVKAGETTIINIKKSDFPELSLGEISASVDFVTVNKAGLKIGNVTLVLPRN
ncbi:hypothetical protein ACT724_01590 [Ornithobacterium rhinotracheale]